MAKEEPDAGIDPYILVGYDYIKTDVSAQTPPAGGPQATPTYS